jgi:ankyrin repeat protein
MQYPLHFAAFKKHPQVVRVMLESGKCSTTVVDRKGRTPAEDTSLEEIRQMILEYRSNFSE